MWRMKNSDQPIRFEILRAIKLENSDWSESGRIYLKRKKTDQAGSESVHIGYLDLAIWTKGIQFLFKLI